MRKVFIRETLSNSSLESCYHLRRTEVCKTIREAHSKIGEPIQIGEITFLTAFNVVLSMLWGGSKFDDVKNQKGNSSLGAVFQTAITKMVELMGKPNISDFFPVLARFDLQGVEREMNEILVAVEQLSENEDGAIPITMTQIKALLMDIVVGGTDSTATMIEWVMAEMMHNTGRYPKIWDNPSKFRPERFLGDGSKWDYTGNNFQYLPFGSKRRICAGIPLAEKMVMYVLASLLHAFNWHLPEGEKLDLSEKFGIVIKKVTPLIAILTQRSFDLNLYA
ncbi:hypothetical protein ACSBR1_041527 [Camellia fascicularis]